VYLGSKKERGRVMRKAIIGAFMFVLISASILFVSPCTSANGLIDELGKAMVREFSPDCLVFTSAEPIGDDGFTPHLHLAVKGGMIDKLRVDEISVEAFSVRFNSPEMWHEKLRLEAVDEVRLAARITEKDINAALLGTELDEHWKNVRIDLRPEEIVAVGVYQQSFIFKFRFLLKLAGGLEVVDGNKVYLTNYQFYANGFRVSQETTDKIVEKIQPILDLSKFIFPAKLKEIRLSEEELLLYSDPPPSEISGGIVWSFKRSGVAQCDNARITETDRSP
jgi:hypothetical protein